LGIEDATANDLYAALDWLYERQERIENKLAKRHLTQNGMALYDLSNSHYEGHTCNLAQLGHDKDGRRGASIIAYGLLTDPDGRPVSMTVYPGNTGDPATVGDQVHNLRWRFGLDQVILVGDRGTLTKARIESLKAHPGLGWISALRSTEIRTLLEQKNLQLSLFDEQNLAEIESPEFPDERLVACFNPLLADERHRKRNSMLEATEKGLTKIQAEVMGRTRKLMTAGEIGEKVGLILHRYKLRKHFSVLIADGQFTWSRKEDSIRREEQLDGLYVIRTSAPADRLSAEDTVRSYKLLAQVETGFRNIKGPDIRVRPIFHRVEERVRAHFFMCMLAYYVEWHMRQALAPLLFQNEDLPLERKTRDPVAKPEPSPAVKAKKGRKMTPDGLPVHSFNTLLEALGTQTMVKYRLHQTDVLIEQLTVPTPLQTRALELLGL
jgi:transposase